MAIAWPSLARCLRALFIFVALAPIIGCTSLNEGAIRKMLAPDPETTQADEAKNRERFQQTQDPDALRWLLGNCIENGMTRAQIEAVIGQSGRYEPNDRTIKSGNEAYLTSDKVYAFGPDSESHIYYLVLRDNRLVGFDPKEFREAAFDSTGL